jgi:3-polyprenyl-4-hydroxybenzoate decarboxylase
MVVGLSGASGIIYGVETLKVLKELKHPCHLIVSANPGPAIWPLKPITPWTR